MGSGSGSGKYPEGLTKKNPRYPSNTWSFQYSREVACGPSIIIFLIITKHRISLPCSCLTAVFYDATVWHFVLTYCVHFIVSLSMAASSHREPASAAISPRQLSIKGKTCLMYVNHGLKHPKCQSRGLTRFGGLRYYAFLWVCKLTVHKRVPQIFESELLAYNLVKHLQLLFTMLCGSQLPNQNYVLLRICIK
jgi:hypothetical protein